MTQSLTRDIAAMIGSRICHDLISPVGAISNGIELLAMSGAGSGPEISLISESVDNANARVRFFRIAFGLSSEGQQVSGSEMASILRAISSQRLRYLWDVEQDMPRDEVKLACLMIMCVETALPRGGEIKVSVTEGRWDVRATGPRLIPSPDLWSRLGQITDTDGLRPSDVQFLLAPLQAEALGRKIIHRASEGTLILSA